MKAYHLSIKDADDAGEAIVFANTVKEAKKQVWGYESLVEALDNGWIALQAHRDKRYDDMENLSVPELSCKQWRDGWYWFDMEYLDPDETTDAEFIKWYVDNFGNKKTI